MPRTGHLPVELDPGEAGDVHGRRRLVRRPAAARAQALDGRSHRLALRIGRLLSAIGAFRLPVQAPARFRSLAIPPVGGPMLAERGATVSLRLPVPVAGLIADSMPGIDVSSGPGLPSYDCHC